MFNATYFTYDGVHSGIYGLQIASLDSETIQTTSVFAPTFNSVKPARLHRFFHAGTNYDDMPEYQFMLLSQREISEISRREVIRWLLARNHFKRLQLHQPDLESYQYNCVFTNINTVFVNGHCCGFEVTAKFDSPYCYGEPTSVTLVGHGEEQTVRIANNSDLDGYVYPSVTFLTASMVNNKNIVIINKTDDNNRAFEFGGLKAREEIKVDNELKIITSNLGGDKLSCFNKNWLRLRNGGNELKVIIDGTVTIQCPSYILMGF